MRPRSPSRTRRGSEDDAADPGPSPGDAVAAGPSTRGLSDQEHVDLPPATAAVDPVDVAVPRDEALDEESAVAPSGLAPGDLPAEGGGGEDEAEIAAPPAMDLAALPPTLTPRDNPLDVILDFLLQWRVGLPSEGG
eukprot:15464517-Alexandrium_andersonii.AAC.1